MTRTLAALASIQLIACASPPDECQPGDIDCAADSNPDGKADGWGEGANNPEAFAQHLEYHLDQLPMKGWRDKPAWATTYPEAVGKADTVWTDTYWPATDGSHNARWQDAMTKSPLEKYDAAFNNAQGCDTMPVMYGDGAKANWDTYNACAGPAAKWQTTYYETIGYMHDGIDNDNDGVIDNYGSNGIDGVQGWWGSCHAWTPASQMIPEPQHAVDLNGVHFEVGDIKALVQNVFDQTDSVMLGGRCNDQTITHDANGSANTDCADVNPGAMHVVMANFLGVNQLPLIEDRTASAQVWNQPIVGYEVTKQDKIDATAANMCVGAMGDKWTYNTDAQTLYEVQMTVSYVHEGGASTAPLGYKDYVSTDNYHYILEIGYSGKILGGRYCTESETVHPDFLWSPTGGYYPSNSYVDRDSVKQLIKLSIAAQ
jgi:hypothetical protein